MQCSKKIIASFLIFNLANPLLANTEEEKKKSGNLEYLAYFGIPIAFMGTTLAYFKFDALKGLFKKKPSQSPPSESYTPSDSSTMGVITRPTVEIEREIKNLVQETIAPREGTQDQTSANTLSVKELAKKLEQKLTQQQVTETPTRSEKRAVKKEPVVSQTTSSKTTVSSEKPVLEIPETLLQYRHSQKKKPKEKTEEEKPLPTPQEQKQEQTIDDTPIPSDLPPMLPYYTFAAQRGSNKRFEIIIEQSSPIYFYTDLPVEHIYISEYFVELDEYMEQFLPTIVGQIHCLINLDLTKKMLANSTYQNGGFLSHKGDHFMWWRIIDATHSTICFKKLQRLKPHRFLQNENNADQTSSSCSEKESVRENF